MSKFEVPVVQIEIEEHPNADALELAKVGGYRAVVKKGKFTSGEWVAYVPEGALMPEWLLKQELFWDSEKGKGMLAGGRGDRVKPARLRGIVSEGIVIQGTTNADGKLAFHRDGHDSIWASAGDDMADFFGIVKYEPPIPVHMAGEVSNRSGWALKYDIENIKKFPDVLVPEETVIFTEKLHGTFVQIGYIPENDEFIIASKGLGAKGLVFKLNDANIDNLYVRIATAGEVSLLDKVKDIAIRLGQPTYILGEIFGRGVQDLTYGQNEPTFRAFDMYVGKPQTGQYVNHHQFVQNCEIMGIDMVPILYHGPFTAEALFEHTNGNENISNTESNIREGVVIKLPIERHDDLVGRVFFKSISEAYLLRRGKTTELQ